MYQIADTYAAIPSTDAVRVALQCHFFPSNLRIDKLPVPDNDRDMLAMRLESLQGNLARLAGLIEKTGPDGYLDPATRNVVTLDYLGMRLLSAVKEVQLLTMYLALNDAWKARDVRPVPKSAAIDVAAQEAVVEDAPLVAEKTVAVDERPRSPEEAYAAD